ncbi:protein TFG-like [Mizuhopecten yessoensis]|uniref:Protein TFG n=1 Tax=Mizuhopecten yessoensis TaxID=6573 RepID=A0A210QY93_MIZYE|nr:protein TFG-like [Mizuhopecten yessoensis]OWF53662.1 Protein TFG [Mizuhopecten yessoensis]
MDLSGKLIIKVQLGEDIRRIPIHNEDITYDELLLMMQRVYRGRLSSTDDITIKYRDEDKDLITIFDDSDLTFAIQCSRILKITLFVNGRPQPLETEEVKLIKKELQLVRDTVNHLLDRLEPQGEITSSGEANVKDEPMVTESGRSQVTVTASGSVPVNAQQGKEFDPLSSQRSTDESQQSKVISSFGLPGQDRSGTPDSLSSIGSSSSNQLKAQQQAQQLLQQQTQQQQQQQQQPQQQQPAPSQPATSDVNTSGSAFAAPQPPQAPTQTHMNPSPQHQMYQGGPNPQQQHPGQPSFPNPQPAYPAAASPSSAPSQQPGNNTYPQATPGYAAGGPGQQQQRPQQPPQVPAQGIPGQPSFSQQPQSSSYAYQYGNQPAMPQPGMAPTQAQGAPWNQPPGGYQSYTGQPQPSGAPTSSPSGTPGSASPSNPYARGTGQGYGAGYPKPTQGYTQSYK